MSTRAREWICRLCFGVVFVWNVLCALQFLLTPAGFAGAYQLSGVAGEVAVQGVGVAFLMWNATYPLFILRPSTHKVLGGVIIAQQVVGLGGEVLVWAGLPAVGFEVLSASILRFVVFDAAGLVLMVGGFYLCFKRASA